MVLIKSRTTPVFEPVGRPYTVYYTYLVKRNELQLKKNYYNYEIITFRYISENIYSSY